MSINTSDDELKVEVHLGEGRIKHEHSRGTFYFLTMVKTFFLNQCFADNVRYHDRKKLPVDDDLEISIHRNRLWPNSSVGFYDESIIVSGN